MTSTAGDIHVITLLASVLLLTAGYLKDIPARYP